jgi:dihydrofolate reductase
LKASVFIGTSLDGFIARENGDLDWLPGYSDGEDYGYEEFAAGVDAVVMGRNTYEKVVTFGEWPYGKKTVIVLSHAPLRIPGQLTSVESMSGTPAEIVSRLSKRGLKHLYVDGGKTIQTFLEAGLIQELTITRVPVLIGRGIPLFGPLKKDIPLRHIETRHFPDGLVQSRYEVVL